LDRQLQGERKHNFDHDPSTGATTTERFSQTFLSRARAALQGFSIIIRQLPRIPNQTPYRFANTLGGALFDYRVGEFGPFTQALDFHKHLIPEYMQTETRRAITMIHSCHNRSFFTHADINWTNILVGQGRLAALVDWECAGYFPEYWEFTKAMYGIMNDEAVEKVMRDAFDQDYGDELKVEQKLWRVSPWGI
jgi:aminoglycoside phosphotransferase (APT) family kinase protein